MFSLRFVGAWTPLITIICGLVLAIVAWWLYRRELRNLGMGSMSLVLPTLRGTAIFLIVVTLAEPVVESRRREGQPGRVLFLIDDSASMSMRDVDDASSSTANNRFESATLHLIDPLTGILPQIASEFEISVRRFGSPTTTSENSPLRLWESSLAEAQELPLNSDAWVPSAWSDASAVGDALATGLEFSQVPGAGDQQSVVVLLTDGQSNTGMSPPAIAEQMSSADVPVFAIGYGPAGEPVDLALQSVDAPERVYRTDVLQGNLTIFDSLPPGTPFSAEIVHADQVVWREDLVATGIGQRDIAFKLPIAPRFDIESAALPHGAQYSTLPLKLEARLSTLPGTGDLATSATTRSSSIEANVANNNQGLYLSVASRKSRVLLIDGRSRWETRYLRNLFARDPAWDIDTVLASARAESSNTRTESQPELPQSRGAFDEYNLVILGDADSSIWRSEQLLWLAEFVQRGGGLILIDGARGHLQEPAYEPLQKLLPIRWRQADAVSGDAPQSAVLTSVGRGLEALQLVAEQNADNAAAWSSLPELRFVSMVEPLPGSEVLMEASSGPTSTPLLITRRYGAGRVLFSATDETWRWRYKVADLVHQRFWNQLARWTMRIPLSVQSEFASLDTGAASHPEGQSVEIRCTLRGLDGEVATDKIVTAIVQRNGVVAARLPLSANTDLPGSYSAELQTLAAGDYQVRIEAAGYPKEALDIESKFTVVAPPSPELLLLAQNEPLLRQLAETTGGEYLPANRASELSELLRPLSGGRITQSATLIWQSYWWFIAALLLLVAEWILRKRSGLI
ncbi:MAG: vWA domain-containing protein [Pirellulaceae bacterium]